MQVSRLSGFEALLGSGKHNLTPAEGFTGLALCAVEADRRVNTEELKELASRLNDLEMFSGFGKAKILKGAKKALEIYEERGRDTLLERSLAAIPDDQAPQAYETVVAILAADRRVTDGERAVMNHIQQELPVAENEAQRMRRAHDVEGSDRSRAR